jgi:iron(III) transport system permease protein
MIPSTRSASASFSAAEPRLSILPKPGGDSIALGLAVLVVGTLCLLPLLRLVLEAIAPGGTLDLATAERVLARSSTWRATWRTLEVGFLSMLVSLALGLAMALLVAASDIRLKAALVFAFMLPLMIPPQITALAWIQLTGASSPLLRALGIAPAPGTPNPLYSREGLILLLGIQHAPLVFITVAASLRRMTMELLDAAFLAGASRLQTVRWIILPLLAPALVAGGALAFVSAIGNFGIAAMIGIPARYTLLPVLIYERLASFGPTVLAEVAVLAVIVGGLALAGVLLQRWLRSRRDVTLDGLGGRPLVLPLGPWRLAAEAGAWLLLAVILVLPLTALLAAALTPAAGVRLTAETLTFANFHQVVLVQDVTRRAFVNSTVLAGSAALLLALFAIPLAYLIAWRPSRLTAITDTLAELPYALPGVVLAVAFIMLLLPPLPILGVSLYGTHAIILLAYLAAFLTLALRPTLAGMAQLAPAIDEAAQLDGAGLALRLRYILLPLVGPMAAAGGILVFMTAFNELTVSALLWTSGTETLGVVVFNLNDSGYTALAASVACLAVVAILALMTLAQWIDQRSGLGILPWSGPVGRGD